MWDAAGLTLREDVLALLQPLQISLLRYPGGNFASGYHWEDGIGDRQQRPQRFDAAWSARESNQVGTDEYMQLIRRLGAQPFLVVNDGSGSPQEAAGWVAYCNALEGEPARRRAKNGFSQPHRVKIWGLGNEAWGQWQIGATTAEKYALRACSFAAAMRAVDPDIRLVAVGNTLYSDQPDQPGRLWNEAVLRQAASQIDDLSFHLYQPDRDGWQDRYDAESLHLSVCAAPLEAERMIARLGAQIAEISPNKKIGVVLDEWNLWLTPGSQAGSMHQVVYTMRDALYCAGMLNVFQRQCNLLTMANLAQLVNVLPLLVTDQARVYTTPIYWPFRMYTEMQPLALRTELSVSGFDSQALGKNVPAERDVPWLELAATRSDAGGKLTLALINRQPWRPARVEIGLTGFDGLRPVRASLLAGSPLAANSFDAPGQVLARPAALPELQGGKLLVSMPACSLLVLALEKI